MTDRTHRPLLPREAPKHFSNAPGITLGISHKTDGEKESWFPWPFTSPPGKRLMTDLAVALSAASMTAPVPIVLDSKRLDRLESGPHSKVLAVRGLELFHRGDKPIVLPRYLFELLEEEERSGSAQGDDRIYSGYMLLKFSRARQRSFFCFVDDGAVLERLYLPSTPSISYQVYVNGQGLSTDLGGLSLLGTKPRQIRIDRAFEEVRRKLAEFCEVGGLPEGVSGGLEGELRELASEPMWVTEAGT